MALSQTPTNAAFDGMGVLFTKDSLNYPPEKIITQKPQIESLPVLVLKDTMNWMKIEGSFRAIGNEQLITVGQFNTFSDLTLEPLNGSPIFFETYYYIDSVVVLECAPPDGLLVELPNVFSPNGDGDNDTYYITLDNVESAQITIFNRWGNTVYKTTNLNFVWSGTQNGNDLAEGVYYIVVNAKGLDGEEVVEKQTVHLVR